MRGGGGEMTCREWGEGKEDGMGWVKGGGGADVASLSLSFPARSTRGRHVTSRHECCVGRTSLGATQNLARTWRCVRAGPALDMRASV